MCAIISWNGKLPKGLLTQLLLKSERRGRDSTGLAFRVGGSTVSYRQAIPASEFVSDPDNNRFLGDARRALMGIAHTRRASPNMPIDNKNAHPFLYWRYFFAHNGKIQNWRELQEQLVVHFTEVAAKSEGETRKTAEWCINYCRNAQTDSKILGPYIHTEDFTPIVGCMALVWLHGDDVYTTRMAKEATATTVVWRYINPPKDEVIEDSMVTLIGSTHEIIDDALKSLARTIEYDCIVGPTLTDTHHTEKLGYTSSKKQDDGQEDRDLYGKSLIIHDSLELRCDYCEKNRPKTIDAESNPAPSDISKGKNNDKNDCKFSKRHTVTTSRREINFIDRM